MSLKSDREYYTTKILMHGMSIDTNFENFYKDFIKEIAATDMIRTLRSIYVDNLNIQISINNEILKYPFRSDFEWMIKGIYLSD